MTWLPTGLYSATDERGIYELYGAYRGRGFEWRARVIATDGLLASSWDRGYVESVVERHAAQPVTA